LTATWLRRWLLQTRGPENTNRLLTTNYRLLVDESSEPQGNPAVRGQRDDGRNSGNVLGGIVKKWDRAARVTPVMFTAAAGE